MIGAHPQKRWAAPPAVRAILREECERGLIAVAMLLSPARHREVVLARRRVVTRLAATGMTLSQIGRYLRINHASVLAHLRKSQPAPVALAENYEPDEDCGLWAI